MSLKDEIQKTMFTEGLEDRIQDIATFMDISVEIVKKRLKTLTFSDYIEVMSSLKTKDKDKIERIMGMPARDPNWKSPIDDIDDEEEQHRRDVKHGLYGDDEDDDESEDDKEQHRRDVKRGLYGDVDESAYYGSDLNSVRKMKYNDTVKVTDIQWDADDMDDIKHALKVGDLRRDMIVPIPADLDDEEVDEYISDFITDKTGWTHKGFNIEEGAKILEDREDRTDVADRLADLANSQITDYFASEDELHDFMYNELTYDEDYHDGGKTLDWAMGRVNDDVKAWIDEGAEMHISPDIARAKTLQHTLPSLDRERYQTRDGLEGPFMSKSGKVVYYDPIEGSYYDPDTDIYLSYEEWKELSEAYSVGSQGPDEEGADAYVDTEEEPVGATEPMDQATMGKVKAARIQAMQRLGRDNLGGATAAQAADAMDKAEQGKPLTPIQRKAMAYQAQNLDQLSGSPDTRIQFRNLLNRLRKAQIQAQRQQEQ